MYSEGACGPWKCGAGPVRAEANFGQSLLARVVFALDEKLRRRNEIFDYAGHPDCIFRVKITALTDDVGLAGGLRLRPGDRIIELHFRNQHFPRMDRNGATIQWARRAQKLIDLSLRELCDFLHSRAEFDDIAAIRAILPVRGLAQLGQFERIAVRFGFELAPEPSPRDLGGRMHRLGQNALRLLLVLAGNPNAARLDILWRRAAVAFLSRRALNQRYLDCRLHQLSSHDL
jgi:hypothetical protein